MEWFLGWCQDDVGFSRTPWKRVWVNRCGTLGQLPVLAMNVIVVNNLYGCYNESTQQDRRTCEWRTALTWYTMRVWTGPKLGTPPLSSSGLSHFIWPMGRRGVFDVCETWCETVRQDVPLLADVHWRIPERMTWWGERWHRDSTPTNVKKERAWEYSTWSDTLQLQLISTCSAAHPTCHGSDHSADEGFSFFLETRLLRSVTTNSADTELIMSSGPSPPKPLARI